MAKLADVARAAGVSQGTASNVFNRPDRVRPEVRAKVEAAARALAYRGPDPKGRLLRAGKVNAIGLVVMDNLTYFVNEPFCREFMKGVAEVCDERGAGMALVSAVDTTSAAWNIGSAVVDGFILYCVGHGDRLLELTRRRQLPFVAADVDAGPDANSILTDNRGGARLASGHLIGLGHRRFGILSLETVDDGRTGRLDRARRLAARYAATRDRLLGYEEGLAAAGIAIDDVPAVESFNDRRSAAEGAAMLFDMAPEMTAVLAMSDVLALAVIEEAGKRSLDVPKNLSVIGFDDVPEAAASTPPLTTITQSIVEKGRLAAHMIFDGGPPRKELMRVSLVERASTAAPPDVEGSLTTERADLPVTGSV